MSPQPSPHESGQCQSARGVAASGVTAAAGSASAGSGEGSGSRERLHGMEALLGESAAVVRLRLQAARIAPHFRTALVTGEAGSGKEMVARALHRQSGAASGPFQPMEISSFAQRLEPFALSGVLYLRGLDTLEPPLQEKVVEHLRAVQRDVRIIVASGCELRVLLTSGRMLQGLAARVGTLEIRVAPLRDRMEDFEAISMTMLLRARSPGWFGEEAMKRMKRHGWPGNFAELWSLVEHVSRVDGVIEPSDLPALGARTAVPSAGARLDRVMQRHVFEVLGRCGGNKLRAAEVLGISRSTLYRMLDAAGEQAAHDPSEAAIEQVERRAREGVEQERRVAVR